MKLSVLQENLKNAVNLTSHFISNKAQLPILSNILIKVEKNKLTLSATNLENSITTAIPVKSEDDGEITVNGKTLNEIISNLSSGVIEMKIIKEQLELVSSNFKSIILGSNASDFPKLPNSIDKNKIIFSRNEFIDGLSKILFSVSTDETRPVLTGVLFSIKDNNFSLVSTDGFRLSEINLKSKIESNDMSIIIPRAILNELTKVEDSGDIQFSFNKDDNQVIFALGETILSSRVIEGDFPDYKKIIPKNIETTINVDKNEFEKAIKLSSIFARDSGNIIKLSINGNKLLIKAESSTSGNQETEIDVRSTESINVEIMFNFRFLEEAIKVIEDDEIQINITGINTASIFIDPKSKDFLHLVMPIKSQN